LQTGRSGALNYFFSDFMHCEKHRRGQGRYLLEQEFKKKDFDEGKLIQTFFSKEHQKRRW
jgi:hypothetical protein